MRILTAFRNTGTDMKSIVKGAASNDCFNRPMAVTAAVVTMPLAAPFMLLYHLVANDGPSVQS